MQQPSQPSVTRADIGKRVKEILARQPASPQTAELLALTDDAVGDFIIQDSPELQTLVGPQQPLGFAMDAPRRTQPWQGQQVAANLPHGDASPLSRDWQQLQAAKAAPRIDLNAELQRTGFVPEAAGGLPAAPLPTSGEALGAFIGDLQVPGIVKTGMGMVAGAAGAMGAQLPSSVVQALHGAAQKVGLTAGSQAHLPGGDRTAVPNENARRAVDTFSSNLRYGLTAGLHPQTRADILDPQMNDPRYGGLALTGQLVGTAAPLLAGGAIARTALAAPAEAAAAAVRLPRAAGALTQAPIGAVAGAAGSVGRQQLLTEAGVREPGIDLAQTIGEGLLGGVTAALPGGVGLGAKALPIRAAAGAASGALLGAGSGLLQQKLAQEPGSPAISLDDPAVAQSTKLMAVIGAVGGILGTAAPAAVKPPRNPQLDPLRSPYSGAVGESLQETISRIAGKPGTPITRADFKAAWKRTGLPTELLEIADLSDLLKAPGSKGVVDPGIDPEVITQRIQTALAQLPLTRGQSTTLRSGKVIWTPDDPALASPDLDTALIASPAAPNAPLISKMARTASGGIKVGVNEDMIGEILATSLYKKVGPPVVLKELLQNAVDATNDVPNGRVEVDYDPNNSRIGVADNGRGLTRDEIDTVFTDLASSGKRQDATAAGGFGLAKASFLIGGKRTTVTTVAREADGQLYEHSFTGDREAFLKGLPVNTRRVDPTTPTGTKIQVEFADDASFYGATDYLDNLQDHSPALRNRIVEVKSRYRWRDPAKEDVGMIEANLPGAKVRLRHEAGSPDEQTYWQVGITNQGIYQFSDAVSVGKRPVKGASPRLSVDIIPTVAEGNDLYPFTANRESLRDTLHQPLREWIKSAYFAPLVQKAADELKAQFANLPRIAVGFREGQVRSVPLVDPHGIYPQLQEFLTPATDRLLDVLTQAAEDMSRLFDAANPLTNVGIFIGKSVHGLHTSASLGGEAIYLNPATFAVKGSPAETAGGLAHTIIHELAHRKVRPHDENFTIALGDLYSKLGTDTYINLLRRLEDVVSDGQGGLHPDVNRLVVRTNELLADIRSDDPSYLRAAVPSRRSPVGPGGAGSPNPRPSGRPGYPASRPAAVSARQLALYKLAALADGADELVIAGRRYPVSSAARWQLEHHARIAGVPGPLGTHAVAGTVKLRAAAEQASALTYALPAKRLPLAKYWEVIDNISTGMFRRWTGLNTLLEGRKTVDPDLVQARIAPYWQGTEVVATTPNAHFRDVGFLPTLWWRGRLDQLRTAQLPADRLELAHLEKLAPQAATRFTPWHIRAFKANALGDSQGWVLSEPSAMPTQLPQVPIGAYRNGALAQLNTYKDAYNQTPTPQLEARIALSLRELYGSKGPAWVKTDPDAWRFHTYMRAVMAATENGAPHVWIPVTPASQAAVQRIFAELSQTLDEKSLINFTSHELPVGTYAKLRVTDPMRKSISTGFQLPSSSISGVARGIAAAALLDDEGETDTEDGGKMILAAALLPRLSPAITKWLKAHYLTTRMATGGLVGAAGGKLVASDDRENLGAITGFAMGVVATAGASRAFAHANPALWSQLDKVHAALPNVSGTLQPNALRGMRWDQFRRTPGQGALDWTLMMAKKVREAGRELHSNFTNFSDLKRLGEVGRPALIYFNRYNRQVEDRSIFVQGHALPVVETLPDAAQFRLFDEFLQVRTRIEDYLSHEQVGQIEQPDILVQAAREQKGEAPLSMVLPDDLTAMHQELSYLVQQHPEVQLAVERFDQMIGNLNEEMVTRGMLKPEDVAKTGSAFLAYKIFKENPTLLAEIPGAGPLSIAAKANPESLQLGMGPTLHGYTEVIPKFLGELRHKFIKDDLVADLVAAYAPERIIATYGQEALQQLDYVPHNWVKQEGIDNIVMLPRKVKEQLDWQFDGIDRQMQHYPQAIRMANRATAVTKGWIINASLGTFYLNNFLGDLFTNVSFTPTKELPKLWHGYVDAAWSEINPDRLPADRLALIKAGDQQSLGIGGASAELSDNLRADPQVFIATLKPEGGVAMRYLNGVEQARLAGLQQLRRFRSGQEALGRKAAFLQLYDSEELRPLTPGARAERAALMADQRISSYSDTSPDFRTWIKGLAFPFLTWYVKQAQQRIPGIARDAATLSRGVQSSRATAALTKGLVLGFGASLINEVFTSEIEAGHTDYLKSTPHINIPVDKKTAIVLSFPFPGTAVANMVGLGGFTNRVVDMLAGRSTLWDQAGLTADKAYSNAVGLVTPLATIPYAVATGKNARTQQPITDPRKPWTGKAADYAKFIATSLPPFSTVARSATESGNVDETLGQFVLRATIGSVYQKVNVEDAKLRAAHRDFMKAISEGMADYAERRYAAMHAEGKLGVLPAPTKKDLARMRLTPTKNLLESIGPLQVKLLYGLLAQDWKLGGQLGLKGRPDVMSFMADLSDLSRELAHESGGKATFPDGGSWDSTWRVLQMSQQHPAIATYDEIIAARKKRTSTLFRR